MHVCIVGGGVIGTLSAYYLDQAGVRVTLIEREADLACGTSGMNAAQLSYSYVSPLGSPAVYALLRRVVAGQVEDVKVTKWLDPQLLSWGVRLLRESTKGRYKASQDTLLSLTLESRELMDAFRKKHGFAFDHAENGKLHLYVDEAQVGRARAFAASLEKYGIRQAMLTPAQCLEREPALHGRQGPLAGGMFSPVDHVGDCRTFTRALKGVFSPRVTCRTGTAVAKIHAVRGKFSALETDGGERIAADVTLVCAGAESHGLLKTAGIRTQLYPVKGYAVTLDNDDIGLKINVTDHFRRVVYAAIGDRMRMAGYMHFSGYTPGVSAATRTHFLKLVTEAFPRARVPGDAVIDFGFRPYTPQSTPVIGETAVRNLHVNIGHNMLGWTLAHATCRKAAEIISASA